MASPSLTLDINNAYCNDSILRPGGLFTLVTYREGTYLEQGAALIVGRVLILFLRMTKALAKTARSSQMILFQVLKHTKQASLNN